MARSQAAGKSSLSAEIAVNREKERVATLLYEGESCRSPSGKIQIRVITDGSWQKRYGRNSLWGYSAMYGFYTGKVIFVAHRCARCTTCWLAAARGAPPGEHKCTMNWDDKKGADEGAAGNMEKHICLEGVKALYAVGLVVQTLVVDGDTKGLEWVKAHGPAEVAACIGTQLDLNHISKNLGKRLRELGFLTELQCAALQQSFSTAVYKTREESPKGESASLVWVEGIPVLQRRVTAVVPHYFHKNNHVTCDDGCPAKQGLEHVPHKLKAYIPSGEDDGQYYAVVAIFDMYSSAEFCEKLMCKCSTNTAESGNSVLWLLHLPKLFFRPKGGAGRMANAMMRKAVGSGKALTRMQEQQHIYISPATITSRRARDGRTKK